MLMKRICCNSVVPVLNFHIHYYITFSAVDEWWFQNLMLVCCFMGKVLLMCYCADSVFFALYNQLIVTVLHENGRIGVVCCNFEKKM